MAGGLRQAAGFSQPILAQSALLPSPGTQVWPGDGRPSGLPGGPHLAQRAPGKEARGACPQPGHPGSLAGLRPSGRAFQSTGWADQSWRPGPRSRAPAGGQGHYPGPHCCQPRGKALAPAFPTTMLPPPPNAEHSGDFLKRSHRKVPPRQISPSAEGLNSAQVQPIASQSKVCGGGAGLSKASASSLLAWPPSTWGHTQMGQRQPSGVGSE